MSEKGMKVMLPKDKLSGFKSIDLDFVKTTSMGSNRASISQRREYS